MLLEIALGTFCSHLSDEALASNQIHPLKDNKEMTVAICDYHKSSCDRDFNNEKCYLLKIKSSLSFLQPIINEITDNLVNNHGFPLEKQVDVFLVLSELLVNAIEHGNKNIYDKKILIYYYVLKDSVCFLIEDEGTGIDKNMLNEIKKSQGLSLIKALVSCICWKEKGNKVCVKILI